MIYLVQWRRVRITLLILICLMIGFTVSRPHPLTAAISEQTAHLVLPGDTWAALAYRYGASPGTLQQLAPHPNRWRQPAIGSILTIPVAAEQPQQTGQLVRPLAGGLWGLAAANGVSPWGLAHQNGIEHPGRPLFGQLIVVPTDETPREYPPSFSSLTVSHIPARAGEGLGVAGEFNQSINVEKITLGTAAGSFFVNPNGGHGVGLLATGAFFRPDAPELSIQVTGEALWVQPWQFSDKSWTFNDITLTGEAANISQEAIQRERARLFQLWGVQSPLPQWQTPFIEPVDSYLSYSSLYGARRSYNGGPYRTYHEGLDFAAYGGTLVYAPAAGTVVLAETLYVRGGAVIIDHGLGIYSGYYHMSAVHVEPGLIVEAGTLIGEVGTTGLSTGNHLHWDLLVNGIWVDPGAFREQNMGCWILAGWGTPCNS